jgi:hypothetical protein
LCWKYSGSGSVVFVEKYFIINLFVDYKLICLCKKGKGKAVPLQAWTGPEGSRRSRLPDF